MAIAQRILDDKQESLASLPPSATVLEAAQLMNHRHVGSVVVMKGGGLIGIFTERDVMRRVVAEQRDPATTKLAEVMTTPVAVGCSHTSLAELGQTMRRKRIRHVPIVNDDEVLGMVSIGDLNRAQHDEDEETIRYLEQFISVA